MSEFKTKHNLKFEVAHWPHHPDIMLYQVGTMNGQWFSIEREAYVILSFMNNEPGNGHLDDVFEWFEHSCRRDKMKLIVAEVMNKRFKKYLIKMRGFQIFEDNKDWLIKECV